MLIASLFRKIIKFFSRKKEKIVEEVLSDVEQMDLATASQLFDNEVYLKYQNRQYLDKHLEQHCKEETVNFMEFNRDKTPPL